MDLQAFWKDRNGNMTEKPKAKQSKELVVVKDRAQILSDAYLRFALRMVRQERTIQELKRICGVK